MLLINNGIILLCSFPSICCDALNLQSNQLELKHVQSKKGILNRSNIIGLTIAINLRAFNLPALH